MNLGKKLSEKDLKIIVGGQGKFHGPKPSDWEMALGGTTFPIQRACPAGSNLIGYIG
ncbi:hypothetical protein P0W61_003073, partial [Enterococcus faecalis]|nr:hypothetical protein [Enterococcus faecalis]